MGRMQDNARRLTLVLGAKLGPAFSVHGALQVGSGLGGDGWRCGDHFLCYSFYACIVQVRHTFINSPVLYFIATHRYLYTYSNSYIYNNTKEYKVKKGWRWGVAMGVSGWRWTATFSRFIGKHLTLAARQIVTRCTFDSSAPNSQFFQNRRHPIYFFASGIFYTYFFA